ncbi:ribonuclease HI [Desulfonatronovibrio hydrogenovorans]|uniref:ribonuclease HI n=1 Tax=Desulfonatronovibrio hydrogenovorans TaxID=53245 RepID=UPI00048E2E4E|nr:ribonuclease HI [Desulfonatronovibrio hydrogenovorans]
MNNGSNCELKIYTDGACLNNPGPGGYGAVLIHGDRTREISRGVPETTNNRMELLAVISALEALKYPCRVRLYTDSQYIAKAINQNWLAKWQKNGWKTSARKDVKNRDLWERLAKLLKIHSVRFEWVKAHNGDYYNERCDTLAREAAREIAEKKQQAG